MNPAVYDKTMENLKNRIDVRLVSNEKDCWNWTVLKPSYMSNKIYDHYLVIIRKSEVALTLNKSTYVGMCKLDLSKVLVNESHYEYIKNKCSNNSR